MRPLHIVHVISSPAAGGAEVYVKDLAGELARKGHRPAIAFISRSAEFGRSASFEQRYLAELDDRGIPYRFIGHESRRNPLTGALRIRRFCSDQRADIYHSHLKYALLFGAGIGIPHVHTHHNVRRHAPAWMWPVFNRIVTAYVGISALCAERLEVFTGRPVTLIRNAVDPGRIGGGFPRAVPPGETIACIAIGAPGEQKNFGLMVDALALLDDAGRRRVHLDIAGEASSADSDSLRARIAAAGLGRTIRLLGGRNDVPDLLRGAHLFLMSSAWEGMPIALLEATMTGLPFVATDVGGCAEVARLCGNGVIVPPGDAAAFARELAALIAEPARIEALSRSAVDRSPALGIEAAADAHLRLYESLLG